MTFRHLPPPFHWRSVRNIDIEEIYYLAHYIGVKLDKNFRIKSNWSFYKHYEVFDVDGKPLFHIKKSMDMNVFFEAAALHLARIIDIELCPENYIVGNYDVGFWRFKSPIPFVMTTFCDGEVLKKGEITKYAYNIGRHFIFHKFLNLYDVYERHFILKNEILKRIDYDLAFRELKGKYSGFDRWIKKYRLFDNSEFLKGADFEVDQIRNNLISKNREFSDTLSAIKFISLEKKDDKIYSDFYEDLLKYWKNNCIEIFSDLDLDLEDSIE